MNGFVTGSAFLAFAYNVPHVAAGACVEYFLGGRSKYVEETCPSGLLQLNGTAIVENDRLTTYL